MVYGWKTFQTDTSAFVNILLEAGPRDDIMKRHNTNIITAIFRVVILFNGLYLMVDEPEAKLITKVIGPCMFSCIVNKIESISTTLKAYSPVYWKSSYSHVRQRESTVTSLKDSVCWEGINES